ncbi:MAG: T9SS type A sorting domain-containing protein [Sphingobacteriales bacterium]
MRKVYFSLLLVLAILKTEAATITWDGGGDGVSWSDASNWVGNVTPVSTDNVLLDNSVVNGSYIVNLPDIGVSIISLKITPRTSNTIKLLLPSSNILTANAFVTTGTGYTVTIDNGGIFENNAVVPSGTNFTIADSFRINNGGHYIHKSVSASGGWTTRLAKISGTETGTFECDVPGGGVYSLGTTNRTFGNLVFTATSDTITYIISGGSPLTINNNLIINSNATLSIGYSADILVKGNFTQYVSSVLVTQNGSSNNNKIYFQKDFSSSGLIKTTGTSTDSRIIFNGTAVQNLSFSSIKNSVNIEFNNSSGFNLNSNLAMPDTLNAVLTLTSGIINGSGKTITIQRTSAGLSGGSSSSYLNGGTFRQYIANGFAYTFPIGDNHYGPIAISNISNAVANDYFDAAYYNAFHPSVHTNVAVAVPASPTNSSAVMVHSSYTEYWNLVHNAGSIASAAVTLNFTDNYFSGITNKGADYLRVAYYDPGGGQWLDYGNNIASKSVASGVSGSITSSANLGSTAFGVFAFGTTDHAINPLPVLIKSFSASKKTGYNKLDWNVGCRGKELTFEILRSTDGKDYSIINKFTASQNRCNQPFDFNDYDVAAQKVYYRIKITDEYGKIVYTQVAVIINRNRGFEVSALMPNPAADMVYLNISSAIKDKLQLAVTDISGKQVMNVSAVLAAGSNIIPLQVKGLAKGVYTISGIYSDGRIAALHFIKQ